MAPCSGVVFHGRGGSRPEGSASQHHFPCIPAWRAPLPPLQAAQREAGEAVIGTKERPYIPMEVIGKADGDGLGMVHWFGPGGEGDEEMMGE